MKLQFKDIRPNPYRNLSKNPYNQVKLDKLVASINKTGFWDNVVVRVNKAGDYELAYGHHRVEAARRAGLKEAEFIVKNFCNLEMLQVMKAENDEAYGYSVLSLLESVGGFVNSLAAGEIGPFLTEEGSKKIKHSAIRLAPSFSSLSNDGGSPPIIVYEKAYTAYVVAEALDELEKRGDGTYKASPAIVATLDALYLIGKGALTEDSIKELPVDGKNKPGLIQAVRSTMDRFIARSVETKKVQEKVKVITEQMSKLDADRRAFEEKQKEKQAEDSRRLAEANREKNEAEAFRISEEGKRRAEQAVARAADFKVARAALDARVQEAKDYEEVARKKDKDLPTRHQVSTVLYKLKTIISERSSSREELKSLARNKAVTQAERETVRQALLAVSEWYAEQALVFRPVAQVDVLKELKQRETAKHKREEK